MLDGRAVGLRDVGSDNPVVGVHDTRSAPRVRSGTDVPRQIVASPSATISVMRTSTVAVSLHPSAVVPTTTKRVLLLTRAIGSGRVWSSRADAGDHSYDAAPATRRRTASKAHCSPTESTTSFGFGNTVIELYAVSAPYPFATINRIAYMPGLAKHTTGFCVVLLDGVPFMIPHCHDAILPVL